MNVREDCIGSIELLQDRSMSRVKKEFYKYNKSCLHGDTLDFTLEDYPLLLDSFFSPVNRNYMRISTKSIE